MTRTMQRRVRARRLDGLCARGRPEVRRVPPPGYDVTITLGPLDTDVSLMVVADWVSEDWQWLIHSAWLRRRGSWRKWHLSPDCERQVNEVLKMDQIIF